MRKIIYGVLIIASIEFVLAYRVSLSGDKEIWVNTLSFEKGKFTLDNKTYLPGDIREIVFIDKPQISAEKTAVMKEMPKEALPDTFLLRVASEMETQYPDASGLIIYDHGWDILRSDGSKVHRYHFAAKILKSEMLGWAQIGLWFESGRSKARVCFARAILPDGTVVWADTSQAQIAPISGGGPFFSYGEIYTLQIPQVTEGSIVEYVFERDTYNPPDTMLFDVHWEFQSSEPAYSSRFEVRIPKKRELYYIVKNPPGANGSVLYLGTPVLTEICRVDDALKSMNGFSPEQMIYADTSLGRWMESSYEAMRKASPTVSADDTSKIYVWHMHDLPPLIEEPAMPAYSDVTPSITASIHSSWDYLFDWLSKFQKERIKPTAEIEEKVKEIIAGAKSIEEKIDRIYRWVQKEIHYISIKGSISSGQTGHTAMETFTNRYGDCTDKSVLFCTMLSLIGVEAHPVIIMTNTEETIDRCITTIWGNHAISRVVLPDGRKIFLDPTSTMYKYPYFSPADVGVSFVDAIGREVGMIEINRPEDNSEKQIIDVIVDKAGNAKIEYAILPFGIKEAQYREWLSHTQPQQYPIIINRWMSSLFPKAKLTDWSIEGLGDLDSTFIIKAFLTLDSFPTITGDLWILSFPLLESAMEGYDEVNLTKRQYDIEYMCPQEKIYNLTIKIPRGTQIAALPENVELACKPYGDFSLKFEKRGDEIKISCQSRIMERVIPVVEYEKYKDFITKAQLATQRKIFVKYPKK